MLLDGTFIFIYSDTEYTRLVERLDRHPAEYEQPGESEHAYLIYPAEMERVAGLRFAVAPSSFSWQPVPYFAGRYGVIKHPLPTPEQKAAFEKLLESSKRSVER